MDSRPTPMTFTRTYKIRFAHCDPAGIVFYPQYFVLLNDHVEDWFEQALGTDFRALHEDRRLGVPTVHLSCDFTGPSRLGDMVDFSLTVTRLGNASVTLSRTASCGGQGRLKLTQVLTCLDMNTGRACPWPDDIRAAMNRYFEAEPAADATTDPMRKPR